jgi:hypothetical protein
MNQREKIINTILDCKLGRVPYFTMEEYAKMYTDDLVNVLADEFILLREQYDNLLEKANADSQKLLDQIEQLRTNK